MRHHITSVAIGIASGALIVWLGLALESASAQSSALPSNCDNGDLLVVRSHGKFACERPRDALGLSTSCSVGDVIVADSFNQLRCQTQKALVPSCYSGETLVSDGSSGWKCTQSSLPSCSSGETIVSEGSSRWRCVRP